MVFLRNAVICFPLVILATLSSGCGEHQSAQEKLMESSIKNGQADMVVLKDCAFKANGQFKEMSEDCKTKFSSKFGGPNRCQFFAERLAAKPGQMFPHVPPPND